MYNIAAWNIRIHTYVASDVHSTFRKNYRKIIPKSRKRQYVFHFCAANTMCDWLVWILDLGFSTLVQIWWNIVGRFFRMKSEKARENRKVRVCAHGNRSELLNENNHLLFFAWLLFLTFHAFFSYFRTVGKWFGRIDSAERHRLISNYIFLLCGDICWNTCPLNTLSIWNVNDFSEEQALWTSNIHVRDKKTIIAFTPRIQGKEYFWLQ